MCVYMNLSILQRVQKKKQLCSSKFLNIFSLFRRFLILYLRWKNRSEKWKKIFVGYFLRESRDKYFYGRYFERKRDWKFFWTIFRKKTRKKKFCEQFFERKWKREKFFWVNFSRENKKKIVSNFSREYGKRIHFQKLAEIAIYAILCIDPFLCQNMNHKIGISEISKTGLKDVWSVIVQVHTSQKKYKTCPVDQIPAEWR